MNVKNVWGNKLTPLHSDPVYAELPGGKVTQADKPPVDHWPPTEQGLQIGETGWTKILGLFLDPWTKLYESSV